MEPTLGKNKKSEPALGKKHLRHVGFEALGSWRGCEVSWKFLTIGVRGPGVHSGLNEEAI